MMNNGRLFKEYFEFEKTRFTTRRGLADFFLVTALWYMIVVEKIQPWFLKVSGFWVDVIGASFLSKYFSYLSLALLFTGVMIILRYFLEKLWLLLFGGAK